jgi:hypothetical protein
MPNLKNWLGTEGIDESQRAVDAWLRIQRNPTVVTLIRNNHPLVDQTVRVEMENTANADTPDGGVSGSRRSAVLFGVRGHPTVADTDVQRGDLFALNGARFRVVSIAMFPGEVQARAEAWQ